ncbi:hypothetical protein [Castellaniella sp.]|uniref:hypothetical protein n=1 Tax=Castellaniella sp. TaxID=1955812 RepID=UPI002AFFD83C|nr:hypothetical protein [Castellaniella sp.]
MSEYLGLTDVEWFEAIRRDLREVQMNFGQHFRPFELDSPQYITGTSGSGTIRNVALIGGEEFSLYDASMRQGVVSLDFRFDYEGDIIAARFGMHEAAGAFGSGIQEYFAALADRYLGEQMDPVKGVGAKKQAEHDAEEALLLHKENPDWGSW